MAEVRLPTFEQVEGVKTDVAAVKAVVDNNSDGLSALSSVVNNNNAKLEVVTSGLVEANSSLDSLKTNVAEVKEDVGSVKTDVADVKADVGDVKTETSAARTAAESADDKATEIKNAVDSVGVVVEDVNSRVGALQQALESSVYAKICRVKVRLNPPGSTYALPDDVSTRADLLKGAEVIFTPMGSKQVYTSKITSLEDFAVQFTVHVSDAALIRPSGIAVKFGRSATCAYAVSSSAIMLTPGGDLTVDMLSEAVSGTVVEVGRAQLWNPTANDAGASFIVTRITDAAGTRTLFGGFAADGETWVDKSLTKVVIHDCPKDGTTPLSPVERIVATGGSSDAVDVMQRLACLRNIKMVNVKFTGTSATLDENKFIRYERVYTKTEQTVLDVPTYDESGNVAQITPRTCIVKWFCDTPAEADYHLHPLFERYETQEDGSVSVTPLTYGYIARYPIKINNLAIDGLGTVAVAASKSDGSKEVGATRANFLTYCRRLNATKVTIEADGEEDIVIEANSDERLVSMTNISEIDFLSAMAYLMFGVNVQATLPGIMTSAVASTTNGTTDYIVEQGIWTGAPDTTAQNNSMVFLGVEDGTWSSTGWMHPDWINVWKRIITTDENGAIVTNTTEHIFLFCADRAKYNPCNSSKNYDNVTASEEELKINGYREVSFPPANGSGYKRRLGYDSSPVMRDAFLPTQDVSQPNVNMGACDYFYDGSAPASPAAFSASTSYAVGTYVMYDSKVYLCTDAHNAGAWDATHFTLQANATVVLRNWYMVARGHYRGYGASLGIAYVNAGNALSNSNGTYWRSRISLQPLL